MEVEVSTAEAKVVSCDIPLPNCGQKYLQALNSKALYFQVNLQHKMQVLWLGSIFPKAY